MLVWACDRIERAAFFKVLDELNRLGIRFVCYRQDIDTRRPAARTYRFSRTTIHSVLHEQDTGGSEAVPKWIDKTPRKRKCSRGRITANRWSGSWL